MSWSFALVTNVVVTLPLRIWLVVLALATTSTDAAAQSFLCGTVKPGDTASALARRFTGHADNRYQPWFQIVDPARSRVVPKVAYDRILTGWRACVPATRVTPIVSAAPDSAASPIAPVPLSRPPTPLRLSRVATVVVVGMSVALFGAAIGVGWQSAQRSLRIRQSLKREGLYFGQLFVKNFERPLIIDGVAARPIHARLRWVPHRRRLDILLAPSTGRRYPNLDDHRRNVEYDVERIANRLRPHPYVRRPLRAEGQWVVVPFQVKPLPQAGGQT